MRKLFFVIFILCLIVGCTTKNPVITEFGSIYVFSDISGAEIFLDNISTGKTTPDTLFSIPVGNHQITIKKEGYAANPNSIIISVSFNKTTTALFTLNQIRLGSLLVDANVSDCFIILESQFTDSLTPHFYNRSISTGTHIVSVFKSGYSNDEPSKRVLNIDTLGVNSVYFTLSLGVVKKDSIGGLAPDFELKDDYNNNIRFYCYRGFITIINFWAEGCVSCMQELPYLEQIYKDYASDTLKIFGINYEDNLDVIKRIRDEKGFTFELLVGKNNKVLIDYNVPNGGAPQTIIVDRSGKVAYYKVGFVPSITPLEIQAKLNQLLGK
jgi:peroxiredoxin